MSTIVVIATFAMFVAFHVPYKLAVHVYLGACYSPVVL
ncbi:putative membrane protein [Brevibacillus laterosporus GI-9]|nr:putative membrane protein [Brevibacillus laterosporus GI-9]